MRHILLVLVTACVVWTSVAFAQDYEGKNISGVEIKGLERVSDQVVRAKLEEQPGQPYNDRAVSRDIRRLFDLGYFDTIKADATLAGDSVVLTYIVEEKRVIEEIKLIGNKKLKARKVRAVLTLKEGDSFIPESYEKERDAILGLYESKGFANTSVDLVVEKVGLSRVRIIYNIHEGAKARIDEITFVGNDNIPRKELRKAMKTKPAFWFLGGKYEEDKFEADLKNVVDVYGNHGRLEAAIPKTDLVYNDTGKKMNITVYLEEGPEYRVKELDIAGNNVYDTDEIRDIVQVHEGDVHNKGQVAKDAEEAQKLYQSSGYIDADVAPQVVLDKENKTTTIVDDVKEGDLKYIKEVKVSGNEVSQDEVVRREMMIKPGDRYDGEAVNQSKRRLDNTHYFDKVRVFPEDIDNDQLHTNLNVDVEEGKTGAFTFGAGYSTDDGMGGFGELKLDNFDITNWPTFSGGGQEFRLKLNMGDRRDQYSLSFTEPELMGYPIAAGFDIYDESYQVHGGADYREDQRGGQIRFGKALSPYVTFRSAYRYQDTNLSDLPWYVNRELRDQRGSNTTIASNYQLERNTLDNYRDPASGQKHRLTLDLAGMGGDNEFVKIGTDSNWYVGFGKDNRWVFSARLRLDWATAYGSSDDLPLQERFYAGGTNTVRGYDYRDIGPKIPEYIFCLGDDFAIGGNVRELTTLEMKYKVTDILRLYTFMDSGGVWRDDSDINFGDIKYSAGIGLGVDVPRMGPFRVDYGIPLNPDEDQGSGRLHLTTGFRF